MKSENNSQSPTRSYQEINGPTTREMLEPYFISMPVGEFPRRRLRAYILGAAAALAFGIGADVYSSRLERLGNFEQVQKAEVLRESAYSSKVFSGTMLGLLLVTGGLEKLTEAVRNRRRKDNKNI
jgi:hypothetical protein